MDISDVINLADPAKWGVVKTDKTTKYINCANLRKIPKETKCVIIMSFPYYSRKLKGNFSKYAMVPDYHKVIGKRLNKAKEALVKEGFKSEWFVDNSPFYEVETALKAGLGLRGQNGLLIDEDYGSYVFLGEIATAKEFKETAKEVKDCLKCRRCETACPKGAIKNGRIEKDKCYSYITQRKTPLSDQEKSDMIKHKLIWGCDICQDVCPMNRNIAQTYIEEFKENIVTALDKKSILLKDRAYSYRGTEILKRNLLNSDGVTDKQ